MTRPQSALLLPAALALGACAAPVSPPPAAAPTPAPAPATREGGTLMVSDVRPFTAAGATLTLAQAAETITPRDVYARIEFLASDQMRGRDTPSPELELAAAYLVNQYKLMGLEPAGENGTFYQWYPYPLRRLGDARLEVTGQGGAERLVAGRDFYSGGGTAGEISAGLVFAGTGADEVMAPGTLRDRIAVVSLPGSNNRAFRQERTRLRNAAERTGAAAVMYVLGAVWSADSIARYAETSRQPTRTLGGALAYPQFYVSQGAAGRMFRLAGLSLDDQLRRAGESGMRPVPLAGLTARAGLPQVTVQESRAPNVVAMIPGSDPVLRNEYVVISAHMDHVGVGRPVNGDSIYNGADDDASGTTALLEVAQAMASLAERPRRTVVFLHVSGEEKGLLGSEWYSDHPTLPLDRIVANINVDMIGRNSPDSVVVIGKDYSSLGQVVNRVQREHPELRLTASDDLWPEENFFFRSDHFNFARKEVPAIFFFSGVHEDYHEPSDEVEKIDTDKAARISRFVLYAAYEIANDPQRPRWDPKGLAEVRRMTR